VGSDRCWSQLGCNLQSGLAWALLEAGLGWTVLAADCAALGLRGEWNGPETWRNSTGLHAWMHFVGPEAGLGYG
jgi:hypothetical protein